MNHTLHDVVTYLDTSTKGLDPRQHEVVEGHTSYLQIAYQWLSYLVAGGVDAVITLIST